jgi:hypothetical protein
MPTPQPIRNALHRVHSFVWIVTRWTLVIWGVLNGLGVGLLGEVRRRVSRQVARVSGSVSL